MPSDDSGSPLCVALPWEYVHILALPFFFIESSIFFFVFSVFLLRSVFIVSNAVVQHTSSRDQTLSRSLSISLWSQEYNRGLDQAEKFLSYGQ